jgi:hypothetical protein
MSVASALFLPRITSTLDDSDGEGSQTLKPFSVPAGSDRVVVGRGDLTGVTDKTVSRSAGCVAGCAFGAF